MCVCIARSIDFKSRGITVRYGVRRVILMSIHCNQNVINKGEFSLIKPKHISNTEYCVHN